MVDLTANMFSPIDKSDPNFNPYFSNMPQPQSMAVQYGATADQSSAGPVYTTQANPSSGQLSLDPDYLNRQLAATMANNAGQLSLQKAQQKAQTAYQSKLLELQQQGLGQQAQQIAQQYALSQAQLEFQKQQFGQTYGLSAQQQGWQQQFDQQQADLDNAYKTAEQTGFRNGVPTLANMQMQQQNGQFQQNLALQAGEFTVNSNQAQQNINNQNAQFGQSLAQNQSQFNTTNAFNLAQLGQNQSQFNVTSAQQQEQIDNQVAQYKTTLEQQNAQFGVTSAQDQQKIDNQVAQYKTTLDEQARQFNQQQSQQASQFGQTFGEGQRQFDLTTAEGRRQFDQAQAQQNSQFNQTQSQQGSQFGQTLAENQRQANLGAVMNAPRGPADWAAYTNRLRGLQSAGSLPGNLSSFGSVAPVASYSNGGQQTGPVLSNTDLALSMTGQGNASQLQGTPWAGMAQGAGGAQQAPSGAESMRGGYNQDTAGAAPQSSGASSDYGGGSSAYGGPAGGNSAQPSNASGSGSASDISLPSLQKFRRYSPDEQQMGLGYLSESGGPTPEDAQYLMQRQSANYAKSQSGKMMGV